MVTVAPCMHHQRLKKKEIETFFLKLVILTDNFLWGWQKKTPKKPHKCCSVVNHFGLQNIFSKEKKLRLRLHLTAVKKKKKKWGSTLLADKLRQTPPTPHPSPLGGRGDFAGKKIVEKSDIFSPLKNGSQARRQLTSPLRQSRSPRCRRQDIFFANFIKRQSCYLPLSVSLLFTFWGKRSENLALVVTQWQKMEGLRWWYGGMDDFFHGWLWDSSMNPYQVAFQRVVLQKWGIHYKTKQLKKNDFLHPSCGVMGGWKDPPFPIGRTLVKVTTAAAAAGCWEDVSRLLDWSQTVPTASSAPFKSPSLFAPLLPS